MSKLLEVYDAMVKEAEVDEYLEKVAQIFAKYAEVSESLLQEEYGTDYNIDDVTDLARGLMNRDSDILTQQEKVAEYDALGRELAHIYFAEMQKEAAPAEEAGVVDAATKSTTTRRTAKKGAKAAKPFLPKLTGAIKKNPLPALGLAAGAGLAGGALLNSGN